MRFTSIKILTPIQKCQIFELWNKEYPSNLKFTKIKELDDYLDKLENQSHILLLDESDKIKGWYFDFIREGERWFAAILDSEFQGKSYGTQLLELAKKERLELNGWVIISDNYKKTNDQPYKSPTGFYIKNAFKVFDDIKLNMYKISAHKIKWIKTGYNNI